MACDCVLTPLAFAPGLSALVHCEKAAVQTASVNRIMIIAANCAKLTAKSLMPMRPPESFAALLLTLEQCLCQPPNKSQRNQKAWAISMLEKSLRRMLERSWELVRKAGEPEVLAFDTATQDLITGRVF
jgi:hypothetical protein